VPGKDEWVGYEADLDVRYAHRLLFGKTIEEVQQHFAGGRSIERADELLFMPRGAFRYYVQAFARFVLSDDGRGDSDAASSFLNLLGNREERDPGSVAEIYEDLEEAVAFVGAHQEYFEAEPAIYGSFSEKVERIRAMCGRP